MQFVAFEARDPIGDDEEARRNPFLSRNDMRAVIARSLALYQSRNGGLPPRRLRGGERYRLQEHSMAVLRLNCRKEDLRRSADWGPMGVY